MHSIINYHYLFFQILPSVGFVDYTNNAEEVIILEYANTEDVHVQKVSHLLIWRVTKVMLSRFFNIIFISKAYSYARVCHNLTSWVRDIWSLQHYSNCVLNCRYNNYEKTHVYYIHIFNLLSLRSLVFYGRPGTDSVGNSFHSFFSSRSF